MKGDYNDKVIKEAGVRTRADKKSESLARCQWLATLRTCYVVPWSKPTAAREKSRRCDNDQYIDKIQSSYVLYN